MLFRSCWYMLLHSLPSATKLAVDVLVVVVVLVCAWVVVAIIVVAVKAMRTVFLNIVIAFVNLKIG